MVFFYFIILALKQFKEEREGVKKQTVNLIIQKPLRNVSVPLDLGNFVGDAKNYSKL